MIHGGGRAGPHEFGWVMAGYKLDEIEPLRQQLLVYNDIGSLCLCGENLSLFTLNPEYPQKGELLC